MDWLIALLALFILFVIITGIRIVNQYERGVILTLGRYTGTRNPGLNVIIPVVQTMRKVDMRTSTVDVPRQEVITQDNVTIGVDAVVYFRVQVAEKAVLEVQNFIFATSQYAQAAMRDVVGQVDLDTLLGQRDRISQEIKGIVDAATEPWGVDVTDVKIQNIELPQDMKRAMARQAEAERERRAVIISAEGEKGAAQQLTEAAQMLAQVPGAMNIRTLATLEKIAAEPSQKTVYVLPADLFEAVKKLGK